MSAPTLQLPCHAVAIDGETWDIAALTVQRGDDGYVLRELHLVHSQFATERVLQASDLDQLVSGKGAVQP